MKYNVNISWDNEALVWIATSDDISGLVLESGSLDALIEKVKIAIPELIELEYTQNPQTAFIHFITERCDEVTVNG